MDVLKSSRFWMSMFILVSCLILAILKLIDPNVAIATMTGLLAGFGVAKSGKKEGNKTPPTIPVYIVAICLSPILAGCASIPKQVNTTHEAIKAVSQITEPLFHEKCTTIAIKCKEQNDKTCKPWMECDEKRNETNQAIKAVHIALAAALALDVTNRDAMAKQKLQEAAILLWRVYKIAETHGVWK